MIWRNTDFAKGQNGPKSKIHEIEKMRFRGSFFDRLRQMSPEEFYFFRKVPVLKIQNMARKSDLEAGKGSKMARQSRDFGFFMKSRDGVRENFAQISDLPRIHEVEKMRHIVNSRSEKFSNF